MRFLYCIVSCLCAIGSYAQNVGIGTNSPVTRLDINGSFKVSAAYITATAAPTAAQTFTMINAANVAMSSTDSIGRVFDPGGPSGNYLANLNATFTINSNPGTDLELQIESLDLGTGDSLLIYNGLTATSRLIYKVGNNVTSGNIIINLSYGEGFIVFKSNADRFTGEGFSILCKRKFIDAAVPDPPVMTGNSMVFYPRKAAIRAGTLSAGPIGNNSVALGYQTLASGDYSTATGYQSIASEFSSVALGLSNIASGRNSLALGTITNATGSHSTAMGYNTRSKGSYATATGYFSDANGSFSAAMGFHTIAKSSSCLAIGSYNDTLAAESETLVQATDRAFVIGDGSGNSTRSNCFYVLKNGNVWMQGILTTSSDVRLKKNIVQLQHVLPRLMNLKGYNYYWKDSLTSPALQAGLIAQEVQKQLPELVTTSNSAGELAVNYNGMIPYLLEGIKEQQQELNRQKEKIKKLEDEMRSVRQMLQQNKKQ